MQSVGADQKLVKSPENFGSGQIAAFNPSTGDFLGLLQNSQGVLVIPSLWAIVFGGGSVFNGEITDLYFAADIDHEQHGLFGIIKVAPDRVEQ